jgi:hypothetical protein
MHLSLKGSLDRQPLTDRLGDRLLAEYGGAAAAYSLRALNGNGDSVVRVRRASDNDEEDFTAEQIELGEMVNWVNSQTVPPLDIGVETSGGRIPVPEGGTSIGIPAAAYSLRNLSTTYTGNVVDVRRSSGGTESFTAAEVADGTLEAWVSEDTTQYIQFDGVDDFVQSTTVPDIASSTVTITLEYTANEAQFIELQSAGAFHLVGTLNSTLGGSNDLVVASDNSDSPSSGTTFRYNGLTVGDFITIVLNIDATYQITSATVNGASMTTAGSGSSRQETSSKTTLRFGRRTAGGFAYAGYFTNFSVSTDSTYDWDGTEAGAISNGWTVNGSPTSTLLNDGFVTQWYDQSGNDNHATQGTAASQPKIVDAGVLVSGGIDFDGVDDVLGTSLVPPNAATLIGVANWDVEDQATMIIGARDSTNQRSYLSQTSSGKSAIGVSSSALTNVDIVAGDDYLLFGVHSGSTRLLSTNGSVISDSGGSAPNNTIHGYSVGAFNTAGTNDSFMDGTIAEVILYPSDQSANRTAIEANIGETYGITGIPAYDNTVDGFVETWYDQSGNGNDATQSVAAGQPKIVDAGVLVSGDTGKPAFTGDGVDDILSLSSSINFGTGEFFVSTVVDVDTGGAVIGSANPNWLLACYTSSIQVRSSNTNTIYIISPDSVLTAGESYLISLSRVENDITAYVNGVAQADVETVVSTDTFSADRFLQRGTNGNPYPDPVSEVIIYASDQSANRVGIETNINDHYNIY